MCIGSRKVSKQRANNEGESENEESESEKRKHQKSVLLIFTSINICYMSVQIHIPTYTTTKSMKV